MITHAQYYKYFVIYVPGLPLNLLKINNQLDKMIEGNRTLIITIDPDPPYNSLYYELLLVNTTWDLGKALVVNNKVIMNEKTLEPWEAVSYTPINYTWGQIDTLFIDLRSLDPNKHSRTLNPYYNYSMQSMPSDIIVVPINGSVKWDLLNTNINVTVVNGTYKLSIEGYVKDVTIKNDTLDTDLILLNISRKDLSVNPGLYNVKFRIIRQNNTHLILFMLGSRDHRGWLSKYLGMYTKQVIPMLPIKYFKYMDPDDIMWVFNEVLSFYNESLKVGCRYRKAVVNIFEIPLYEDIMLALREGLINETLAYIMGKKLADAIYSYVLVARAMLGNVKVVFYSPYTYQNTTFQNYQIEGLEIITPGLYKITTQNITQVVKELVENNIEFKILTYNDQYYVLVKYREYMVNGYENIGYGYFIMNPATKTGEYTEILVDTETIVGYLASLAHGYGMGLADANQKIDELNKKINRATSQIRDLNNTISRLNGTLQATQRELGRCKAQNLNISGQINELKDKIRELKEREAQWMTYALAGTISIFVIIILLYVIASRGLRKTTK